MKRAWALSVAFASLIALGACATPPPLDAERLGAELVRRPVVLLGEVHDNATQHLVRVAAITKVVEAGARPAIAFEQFDRERQADIDRARREQPADGGSLADHVIAQGRTPKDRWDWAQYRPFVELALRFDLPIVAANLSRADATRIVRQGTDAVFDEVERRALALDRFDELLPMHQHIVQVGHCNLLPAAVLPGLARAQVARDAVLARSLRPYLDRGVILLTGNGHARRDLGVPRHFSAAEQSRVWSIGLLEEGAAERAAHFDVAFLTPVQARPDPCATLKPKQN